ncbi:OmpA family protein [Parapedobacter tibetensis]|uniref:OmpA family protein n=1 Tax=Parapedobacter tibetensis TaxID=2972951 RepID=UPI00214DC606|nr:OmpA family protein [Parapedobacter tibetensis]
MKIVLIGLGALLWVGAPGTAEAQLMKKLAKKAGKAAERTIERRIEKETSENTDKALDKVFEGDKSKKSDKEDAASGTTQGGRQGEMGSANTTTFASYGKFDFVPGEKVIVMEDFSQDAVGDFPAKWNTNASGEIKTIAGAEGKWLALTTKGTVTPDFITNLPENFTLEFDLAVTPDYSFYDSPLMISMASLSGANNFTGWSRFGQGRNTGVTVTLHPQDAGSAPKGKSGYELWENKKKSMENMMSGLEAFNNKDRNIVKISIWRQNQRLRFYVDENKVWDLPRAFATGVSYNGLVFSRDGAKNGNQYLISNLRLAVGTPDTRSKLITEGRFSTTGIYFNTGSAVIKPASYGVLKEIATVLKENPDVNVSIIGYTDSDGSDDVNLKLSKDRAASVKKALSGEFGIDGNRMETDGKGEGEPVGDNNTTEGKAQNRRVAFVKR